MPKYRTTAPMYLPDDRYVEAGVEVGTGTAFELPESFRPSRTMEALDDEAQENLDALNDGNSQDQEEGIAAKMERQLRQAKQKVAELQSMVDKEPQMGRSAEPFRPATDTGPSPHQANIGKNSDGSDRDGPLMGASTPVGASSTTPPRDSIQLPGSHISGRPVPRVSSEELNDRGEAPPPEPSDSSTPPKDERKGPQTGVDDPSPQAQAQVRNTPAVEVEVKDDPKGKSPVEIAEKISSGGKANTIPPASADEAKASGDNTTKVATASRPGDQAVKEPNKDLAVKDTETFMPNNEPNAPNATGPLGSKPVSSTAKKK